MDASPKRGGARTRRRVRAALLAAIGGLYLLSVPWYRESGSVPERWLGLPDWVAVAVLCYAAIAVLNAVAWSLTVVPDVPDDALGAAEGEDDST